MRERFGESYRLRVPLMALEVPRSRPSVIYHELIYVRDELAYDRLVQITFLDDGEIVHELPAQVTLFPTGEAPEFRFWYRLNPLLRGRTEQVELWQEELIVGTHHLIGGTCYSSRPVRVEFLGDRERVTPVRTDLVSLEDYRRALNANGGVHYSSA